MDNNNCHSCMLLFPMQFRKNDGYCVIGIVQIITIKSYSYD